MSDQWRESILVPGLGHGSNPIPSATRVGNLVFSGGISGVDVSTGTIPEDPGQQVALMFDNIRRIIEAAGGDLGDIGRVEISASKKVDREVVNAAWANVFPDERSRPARRLMSYEDFPAPSILVQCTFLAVIRERIRSPGDA